MKNILYTLVVLLMITPNCNSIKAQGGMWLPMLLQNNEQNMQSIGSHISAKQIYDANNASIKDAVMLFGRGCTGEFVSDKGLVFTNHHCGYGQIVKHSTIEHDYLTNGFAAMSIEEELPCAGLTVTLLQYMEDVTTEVLKGITNNMSENSRNQIINRNIEQIIKQKTENNNLSAEIKPIYYGNQYILYVNKVYKDVRLVAAPPSNIGKFGGDTDNWMWPRHTGDFSVFRVYADENNEPATYSKNNKPYKPKKFLKISLKDKQDGDFTFVMGYPGRTQQFITSYAVEDIQNMEDPIRIKLRTEVLNIYKEAMEESAAKRLRYANQVASIANGWKKWQGEVKGLKSLKAIEKKQKQEQNNPLMNEFMALYDKNRPYKLEEIYMSEAVLSSDFMKNARRVLSLIDLCLDTSKSDAICKSESEKLLKYFNGYFANDFSSHRKVDSLIFQKTMDIYYEDFAKEHSTVLREKVTDEESAEKYFAKIFSSSSLNNSEKVEKLLKNFDRKRYKKLLKDPALEFLSPIWGHYINSSIYELVQNNTQLDSLYRVYIRQQFDNGTLDKSKTFPDANMTMRVTYGNIAPFKPKDGVMYRSYTTIAGVMEKENPDIYDYKVEQKLKDIYYSGDLAPYGDHVAFIATNQTTGGNSGSPVMDAYGNLIGLNFDRNWEGTMSDIIYDKDLCRNISLDIRYCLLIIDKYLGAKNLIDELEIVR